MRQHLSLVESGRLYAAPPMIVVTPTVFEKDPTGRTPTEVELTEKSPTVGSPIVVEGRPTVSDTVLEGEPTVTEG